MPGHSPDGYYIPPAKNLPTDWIALRNCKDMDPELFFPERGNFFGVRNAKAVCNGCEVKAECLEYSLTPPLERWGIWGGLSEQERRRIRSKWGTVAS